MSPREGEGAVWSKASCSTEQAQINVGLGRGSRFRAKVRMMVISEDRGIGQNFKSEDSP